MRNNGCVLLQYRMNSFSLFLPWKNGDLVSIKKVFSCLRILVGKRYTAFFPKKMSPEGFVKLMNMPIGLLQDINHHSKCHQISNLDAKIFERACWSGIPLRDKTDLIGSNLLRMASQHAPISRRCRNQIAGATPEKNRQSALGANSCFSENFPCRPRWPLMPLCCLMQPDRHGSEMAATKVVAPFQSRKCP